MKTASLISKSLTGFRSVILLAAVLLAALPAGRAIAAPVVTTISGGDAKTFFGPAMNPDTNSLKAIYHTPLGLALDEAGANLYVADENNNAIRMLDLQEGFTFTLFTNTIQPVAVALDGNGNLYVLERGSGSTLNTNGMIVEYDTQFFDIIATNATHLVNPTAMAIDLFGDIFVTAHTNQLIKITGAGQSTVATVTQSNALLEGITLMPNGKIAACDYNRDGIYDIDPNTGIVTTNAGFNGQGDGTGINNLGVQSSQAKFFHPFGIAASGDGSLIVSDFGNDHVKVITAAGVVTNFYGVTSNYWNTLFFPGWADGTVKVPDQPSDVASRSPAGVILSPDGTTVYTTEDYYHLVRQITGGNFQKMPTLPPPPPSGLTAVLATNAFQQVSVLLTWSEPSDAGVTNYVVERSSSTNSFSILGTTNGTSFTDSTGTAGSTYFYVVEAENDGGISDPSVSISVSIPTLPPPAPTIGWFDYEPSGSTNVVFHPLTSTNTFNNDVMFAISNNIPANLLDGNISPEYIASAPPILGAPYGGGGSSALPFTTQNPPPALPITIIPNLEIAAENQNSAGQDSAVVYTWINFVCGDIHIGLGGTNAALFSLSDITTNVTYYYTTDGTSPLTNAPASQAIAGTNGQPSTIQLNIASNFTFEVVAERPGYAPSAVYTNLFLAANFRANELTWGFASGEASSKFIASPGETFYAPVTLTTLPGTVMYAMEFDMVVTNLGPDPVPSGDFSFQSMMDEPTQQSNTTVTVWTPIPPFTFLGDYTGVPSNIVLFNGSEFVDNEVYDTNLNELAVGWFEIFGKTNLYVTTAQNLLTHSQDYITVFPSGAQPNDVVVGGYAFQVPTNAQPGEQYEIALNRASANNDGLAGADSGVPVSVPLSGSLTNGAINAMKIVTVGQPRYLVGDVYPFQWFNAGDFGFGDLTNYAANDVEAVFSAAIYAINPPAPGSDFADAMDSAGGIGVPDNASGYWTNAGTAFNTNQLFSLNNTTAIDAMAFGDGKLDISDVYVTYLRSQFPGLYWFQRFYTNDTAHGVFGRVAMPITDQTNVDNNNLAQRLALPASAKSGATSITNNPSVHFKVGDYVASAGQTVQIPVTASVFGPNPARMLMFNVTVVPLDGSPAGTANVTFSPNAPFNNPGIFNQIQTNNPATCAEAFVPTSFPISANASISNNTVIGYLNVTIPANATASSAYGLYFTHASASPNGLISFPRSTYTGLITLSSRSSSYYNDGIPDSWRLRYFGTIYNDLSVSNADADGTGMNNWQKYQAGLNPEDPTSVLNEGIDQGASQSPQDFVLYWPSVVGQTYIIERSPTLFPAHWTAISTNIGDGTFMEIHDPSGNPGGYYQVTTQ